MHLLSWKLLFLILTSLPLACTGGACTRPDQGPASDGTRAAKRPTEAAKDGARAPNPPEAPPREAAAPATGAAEGGSAAATRFDPLAAPDEALCTDPCLLLTRYSIVDLYLHRVKGLCGKTDEWDEAVPFDEIDRCEQYDDHRNCIFAAHGYIFKKPQWKQRFEKTPWYRPSPSFDPKQLRPLERRNVELLRKAAQRCRKAVEVPEEDVRFVRRYFEALHRGEPILPTEGFTLDFREASREVVLETLRKMELRPYTQISGCRSASEKCPVPRHILVHFVLSPICDQVEQICYPPEEAEDPYEETGPCGWMQPTDNCGLGDFVSFDFSEDGKLQKVETWHAD